MVQSMIARKNIPKIVWPEAINRSIHVLNRSPTLAIKNMTPEEVWTGHKPSVDHFRIFGCLAYAHVPNAKRSKLDDKWVKYVLLGVSEESKAYRLFNPLTHKVIISRDVMFDEDNYSNWSSIRNESVLDLDANDESGTEEEEQSPGGRLSDVPSNEPAEIESSISDDQRPRKRPYWMTDYVSGDELYDEEIIAFLSLFADSDLIVFNDAVMNLKWRKAMDAKIEAIKKN